MRPSRGHSGDDWGRRRAYSAEFGQTTVEEFLDGPKRTNQICRKRAIGVMTLRSWRIEYEEYGGVARTRPTAPTTEQEIEIAELERVIGQLTIEKMVLVSGTKVEYREGE